MRVISNSSPAPMSATTEGSTPVNGPVMNPANTMPMTINDLTRSLGSVITPTVVSALMSSACLGLAWNERWNMIRHVSKNATIRIAVMGSRFTMKSLKEALRGWR